MSHKMFCFSCTKGTEYSITKPTFCSFCGKPYISTSSASTQQPQLDKPKIKFDISNNSNHRVPDIDNDDEVESVPHIDKIDYEINSPNLRGRVTMENVLSEAILSGKDDTINIKKPIKTKPNKKRLTKAQRQQQERDFEGKWKEQFISKRTVRQSTEIQ